MTSVSFYPMTKQCKDQCLVVFQTSLWYSFCGMQKKDIRRQMIVKRRAIPDATRRLADVRIEEQLLSRDEIRFSKTVCLYVSLPDEVNTHALIGKFLADKKTVILPKVEHSTLSLYAISSLGDVVKGSYGVFEPASYCLSVLSFAVDIFIVPGVAFDMRGFRLGYGKGYYDKLLSGVTVPKIALAYDIQCIAEVPSTSYDVPVTLVISEKQIIDPSI